MKRSAIIVTAIFLLGMSLNTRVGPEEEGSSHNSYSGNFWTRSTLTGDWRGVRNDLAARGISFDMSLTQVGQGVVSGGKDEGWKYGGIAIYIAAQRPKGVPEENWLPINQNDEDMGAIMRVYVPDLEKMKTWMPSKAERVK